MLLDRRWGRGVSEAMSRRVGGTTRSESVTLWNTGPRRRSGYANFGCGGREKRNEQGF